MLLFTLEFFIPRACLAIKSRLGGVRRRGMGGVAESKCEKQRETRRKTRDREEEMGF